jgi:hypothetical protein
MQDYLTYYNGSIDKLIPKKKSGKTDQDILNENYRFLRTSEDNADTSSGVQMAKKYYDKLFREYAIIDLTGYKTKQIGMRWRIEKEVIEGKGQFICGEKRCNAAEGLRSFEVRKILYDIKFVVFINVSYVFKLSHTFCFVLFRFHLVTVKSIHQNKH